MKIWCCSCARDVEARLTTGAETYPHRPDLHEIHSWKCDHCGCHVGCHRGTTRPLGCIPTPELARQRRKVHGLMDPLWRGGGMHRREVYARLSAVLGRPYHTADLRDAEEVDLIMDAVGKLAEESPE